MSYKAFVCETVGGKNLGTLPVTVKSWKREMNGTDTASVLLSPGALTVKTRDNLRNITTPARMSLVVEWSNPGESVGTPVFAGPIWNRNFDGTAATINATGVKSILDRRKLVVWAAPYQSQVLAYANLTLGSIAAQIVSFATSGSKPGAGLPITVPGNVTGTSSKSYNGFNLKTVGSALSDLTNLINGPDIDFIPVWADSNRSAINWRMVTGTTTQPKLFSPATVVYDAGQPKSSVKLLTFVDDASTMATRQWGNGSGTDVDTLMSTASSSTLVNEGWPALEQQKDYKSETAQSNLDAAVQGDLVLNQTLTEQWGLTVDATRPPVLGSFSLGDIARIRVANHVWIPDGDYTQRIIAMQGDGTTSVVLSVQGA